MVLMDAFIDLAAPQGPASEFVGIASLGKDQVVFLETVAGNFGVRRLDGLYSIEAQGTILYIGDGEVGDLSSQSAIDLSSLSDPRGNVCHVTKEPGIWPSPWIHDGVSEHFYKSGS